jgi:hypothetical protein
MWRDIRAEQRDQQNGRENRLNHGDLQEPERDRDGVPPGA